MAFGGESGSVEIVRKKRAGVCSIGEQKPLSEKEVEKFISWWESLGLSFQDFAKLSVALEIENYLPLGNAYLRIRVAEVNGQYKVSFIIEPTLLTARFSRKTLNDDLYIATVKDWDYSEKKEIGVTKGSEIGKPFSWSERRNGVLETIVHLKNREGSEYGRSSLIQVLNHFYAEYEKGNQLAKTERVATVAKYLLEVAEEMYQEPNCDACNGDGCNKCESNHRETVATGLRRLATNEGKDPVDIIVDFYDKETGETSTLHKFDVMRDSAWLEKSNEVLIKAIHSAFNIAPELTKSLKLSGGLNSEQLLVLLITTNAEVIQPIRERYHNFWSHIISELAKVTGSDEMAKYAINFESPVRDLIENIKEVRGTTRAKRDTENSGGVK